MNTTSEILIVILSSSVVAAIVSGIVTAVMQKHNEKESRLFNAKLDAYKEFATHLESRFTSITKDGVELNITSLAEVSSRSLLVSSAELNRELKTFIHYTTKVFERCCSDGYDEEKERYLFDKMWDAGDKIEDLMRKDLGFK